MRTLQLGAGQRPPYLLPIVGADVVCAISRRSQPMLRCSSCPYFQGMLVRPDPCVMCAAPRPPRRRTRARAGSSLVFDQDWPED